jgi:PKD repeat protein
MATEVVTINEINNTVANFSYESPLPFVPTEVTFTNQSQNASEYQWFVNGNLVSNQTNLAQLFELAGVYTITLVASKLNEQCTDTLVKTINLERENYLYLPSTWVKESPLNLYSIGYVKVAFRLLNGLGQVVHVISTPITSEEQNLLGNKNYARGVYFYELTATKVTGEEVKVGGKLIRM